MPVSFKEWSHYIAVEGLPYHHLSYLEKKTRMSYTFGSYEIKQTSLRADDILLPESPKSPWFVRSVLNGKGCAIVL
jgi:hypothetical protein